MIGSGTPLRAVLTLMSRRMPRSDSTIPAGAWRPGLAPIPAGTILRKGETLSMEALYSQDDKPHFGVMACALPQFSRPA